MVELDDDAVEVRRLVEVLAGQLQTGDARWQATLTRARAVADAVTDPRSRMDAQLRIANIDHVLSLNAGDVTGALAHLDHCVELIGAAREIDVTDADQRRLDEQEWGVRLNRSQALQVIGDIDGADSECVFALELASRTENAGPHRAATLCTVAAIASEREQWSRALRYAAEAVDECAVHNPDALGVALVNLAQAHAAIGDYDAASRVADRAEAVVDNVQSGAALSHLRGYIAMGRKDIDRAAALFAEYAESARANADLLEPHHRSESAKALGIGAHGSDPWRAREQYQIVVDTIRAEEAAPMSLVAALLQLSGATQDCALSEDDPATASARHEEACALVAEAAELALAHSRPTMAAECDLTRVRYVDQFHHGAAVNQPALRVALATVLAAAVYLHHASFSSSRHAQRRHFAAGRGVEAFSLAFSLAAELGAGDVIAELVELRSAAAFFIPTRGVRDTGDTGARTPRERSWADELSELMIGDGLPPSDDDRPSLVATAPPPLLLTPSTVVLTEAFDTARTRFGLVDDRDAVETW
ncbi:hypothetical protein GII30_16455 [Gordonia amarae]|uniref:MalT-like TPR region domain-containing protein n=2 Tax=Gordonia amarae TaxID=36821 RepID=G7GV61_9ACTN|nr:hypothetical protein [Gordonia amarae]MCS3880004.1 tetratricopeptide (TPR) repeat protein [Gordonia amarae]QHN18389.1 hypothetical protein GII35_16770 [Gordonia amarae]QHN22871.1 hypothetical protein GII34_16310 [Gordonia amarae]QHN31774.1 hypothetical protein GII32_16620 [Gordonia amarae]QHN40520.1 hypothetical protein GII30_16455 [Gordonia amarae]